MWTRAENERRTTSLWTHIQFVAVTRQYFGSKVTCLVRSALQFFIILLYYFYFFEFL